MSDLLIETIDLKKIYNKGKESECKALNGVSLKIYSGELIAITGKSGSGKSTLLHILGGLDSYTEGDYLFEGVSLGDKGDTYMSKIRNQKMGFVQQDYALINNFSVYENIAIPLYINHKGKNIKEMVMKVAEELEIKDIIKKKIRKLSGGQCQRTAIGRAVVAEPEVIFADEPTGALDSENSKNIIRVLKDLNKKGKTIIICTHDPLIAEECDRVIELEDGVVIKDYIKE